MAEYFASLRGVRTSCSAKGRRKGLKILRRKLRAASCRLCRFESGLGHQGSLIAKRLLPLFFVAFVAEYFASLRGVRTSCSAKGRRKGLKILRRKLRAASRRFCRFESGLGHQGSLIAKRLLPLFCCPPACYLRFSRFYSIIIALRSNRFAVINSNLIPKRNT